MIVAPDPLRKVCGLLMIAVSTLLYPSEYAVAKAGEDAAHWLKLAVEKICPLPLLSGLEAQDALPGSWLLDEARLPSDHEPRIIRIRLLLPDAGELRLDRRQFQGQLRRFSVSYFVPDSRGVRPVLYAIADGTCSVRSGREIRREGHARVFLDQLDSDLKTVKWTETLQLPWPEGSTPDGVRVALVDSGLAYDLPRFRDRLARDTGGTPLGYDYWDLDPWPYDGDVSRGPFLPIRHGTAVASVLAREAPQAALIPFRFPRPDMERMGDLVLHAIEAEARILALPMGSRDPLDWESFESAMHGQDLLAIVSAGNYGHNIDVDPVYPAVLDLENILVVTSADAFGRLAPDSNWGEESVDFMLPAENLEIIDFRGASGVASGASFAVPRLAALAARILEQNPDFSPTELKERILSMATPSPFERPGVVAGGWIPDPLSE